MSGARQSELEGLANRIALLVGDDGEAEAAGRAVGVLARRLGLTGGHLKAIFMAGTGHLGAAGRQAAELAARADRLQGETNGLARSLEQLEIALQQADSERDLLRREVDSLRLALERAQTGRLLQAILGGILLLAVLGGGAWIWLGRIGQSGGQPGSPAAQAESAAPLPHSATVRPRGATVYAQADLAATVQARLPGGVRLPVRRLLWRNFSQWAETELGGRIGYVPVTDLELDQ